MLWMVFDIGCIECGSDSGVVGLFDTIDEANSVAERLNETMCWHDGGQHSFEVFRMDCSINTIQDEKYQPRNEGSEK
jgi:hypothetical protein